MGVEVHDYRFVVKTRHFIAEGLDFLVISKPPNAHAPGVCPYREACLIQFLNTDDPCQAKVTGSAGQGG